jgi:murein DD-endopeptidase MepM/ murein hydrolase activator NlpD
MTRRIRPGWVLGTVAVIVALVTVPWYLTQTVLAPSLRWSALRREPPPILLRVPVAGVGVRRLVDTWGGIRSGNRRHEGIDIFAPRGTAVLSATNGMVSMIGENRLGGNVVWVYGPGGHRHYYAHLEGYAPIVEGQDVLIGDTLGYVGNSGNARTTPPHLHYGIYTDSGAINPYPRLIPPWRRDSVTSGP